MTVQGRLLDSWGRPLANQLIELWQANAAGRYIHQRDQHPAPLDPNFTGAGRVVTNDDGEYKFTTIKPGAYPWKNHVNAWRPAHIHFSVFGTSFTQRIVTQMYFPGDPLFAARPDLQHDPPPGRPRPADRPVRPRPHGARVLDGLPLGHRRRRPGCHLVRARGGRALMAETPSPRRPTWPAPARPSARSSPSAWTTRRSTRSSSRTARARSCSAAPSTTARAQPIPDAVHRDLRRRRRRHGAARARRVPPRRPHASPASAARRPPTTGTTSSGRATPDRSTARRRSSRSIVFARGLPDKLHTRIYLPEDDELLAADPLLSSLDAGRARYLIATRTPDGGLHYDIRLQGEKETVFLAF